MAELLPWLNLLLLPVFGLVMKISATLARLEAVQGEHARRLEVAERQLEHRPRLSPGRA